MERDGEFVRVEGVAVTWRWWYAGGFMGSSQRRGWGRWCVVPPGSRGSSRPRPTSFVPCSTQMQACGQPPQDIVDELAPGLAFGPDGLPSIGGGEGGPGAGHDCGMQ